MGDEQVIALGQYGIAGGALAVVSLILYLLVTKSIPALTSAWAAQMTAEREARKQDADDDRALFREMIVSLGVRLDRIESKVDQMIIKRG